MCAKAHQRAFKAGHTRASPFLSKHCRTLLVNSLVMPYFDYCTEAWSSAIFISLRRLSNLYNKSLKMKEKSPKDPASLQERFTRSTALMFECLNGLAPDYLTDRCASKEQKISRCRKGVQNVLKRFAQA